MSNQEVTLNPAQEEVCAQFHLAVEVIEDGVAVIDQDPAQIRTEAKRRKKSVEAVAKTFAFPRYEGARRDLTQLIKQAREAQEKRNGASNVIAFPPEVQKLIDEVPEAPEPVVEVAPEPVVEPVVEAPRVVPLRRAVLTEEPPKTLTDVVLDESNKKVRKTKVVSKKRDNRYARAYRTLLENPDLTVAEQAKIADVSYDMFVWYDITFRHMYRIIAEKYGNVLPPLPKLKK